MKTLADAFVHTLKDIYYAENQIVKALPDMIEKATDPQLKQGFKDHLAETKGQIKTLEAVFKSIGKKASGEKCDAIEGLIKETEGVIEDAEGTVAKHAAIIGCCQSVEHYEISRYGTLREWAKALGKTKHTIFCRKSSIRRRRQMPNSRTSPSPRSTNQPSSM
jgi:ferritin-like metal-binding protein YciE